MKLIPKCQALVEKLYEWQADHEMRLKQNGYSIAHDRATCITFYDQTYDGFDNILVGVCNDKGAIVGAYMLDDIDRKNQRCEMHFVFPPEGRGTVLKISASAIVDFCFNELHLKSLFGTISATNENALSFVQKMGWQELCEIPNYFSTPIGFVPAHLFMLTKEYRKF